MRRLCSLGIACVVATSLGACGGVDESDVEEHVGEARQELGETACGTVGGYPYGGSSYDGDSLAIGDEPACGVDTTEATSPNGGYDNGSCPDQWITEVTGTYGRDFRPFLEWVYPAPTEANCASLHLYATVYRRNFLGYWYYAYDGVDGQRYGHFQGTWHSGEISYCSFDLQNGPAMAPIYNAPGVAYRIAAKARQIQFPNIWERRVTAGVSYGPGPCLGE